VLALLLISAAQRSVGTSAALAALDVVAAPREAEVLDLVVLGGMVGLLIIRLALRSRRVAR